MSERKSLFNSLISFLLKFKLIGLELTSTYQILTCKYLSCNAEDESAITSEASRKARLAFCSPSAAITYEIEIQIKLKQ